MRRLAERSRPSTLDGYIGQADIVGPGSLLRARIEAGEGVGSCILWGPPGCGKTYAMFRIGSPGRIGAVAYATEHWRD